MRYAKIENGQLVPAPKELRAFPVEFPPLEEGGEPRIVLCTVTNPSPDKLVAAGYLPVIYTAQPEPWEGYHLEDSYTEGEHDGALAILQVWTQVADPEPDPDPEISMERALNIILMGRDAE